MPVDRRTFLKGSAAAAALSTLSPEALASEVVRSNFHAIYGNPRTRDRFFWFLQNVFHLFPESKFHQLILDAMDRHDGDEGIFREVQGRLPEIKPVGAELSYMLPALMKQKDELANQTRMLLEADGRDRYENYLEIGTTGRYVRPIGARVPIEGDVFLVNHIEPGTGPIDVLERGQLEKIGTFMPLDDYARIDLPPKSVDLVTNFIGFHHAPLDRLHDFIDSIHAALRPGGRLVLRDHDVDGETMDAMVALAHDVFNIGVYTSWEDNAKELRHFRSKEEWTEILKKAGFERDDLMLAQSHDPTDNILMSFKKA